MPAQDLPELAQRPEQQDGIADNFDLARLRAEVLEPARDGEVVRYQRCAVRDPVRGGSANSPIPVFEIEMGPQSLMK